MLQKRRFVSVLFYVFRLSFFRLLLLPLCSLSVLPTKIRNICFILFYIVQGFQLWNNNIQAAVSTTHHTLTIVNANLMIWTDNDNNNNRNSQRAHNVSPFEREKTTMFEERTGKQCSGKGEPKKGERHPMISNKFAHECRFGAFHWKCVSVCVCVLLSCSVLSFRKVDN